jgi:endonuclease YncB( thermonuclease family)
MRCVLLLVALLLSSPAYASEFVGRVVAVLDGDTLDVLPPNHKVFRVRLAEIDAPEKSQPYGSKSKQQLAALVFGKEVHGHITTLDRYGRSIARLHRGELDINAEMVRQGAAWRYVQYSTDAMFVSYEFQAKAAKRGLWALQPDQRIPPWEWRKGARRQSAGYRDGQMIVIDPEPAKRTTHQTVGSTCGGKRYCSQMVTCAEAMHYLRDCGVSSLDGDQDGKPCERLCGH